LTEQKNRRKMAGRRKIKGSQILPRGGDVKSRRMAGIAGLVLLGAALLAAGCKQAPELTQANAASLIQANYAQAAPVPINIVISDLGMRQGVTEKYWNGVKRYPNGYWADFKLTPDGKRLVTLPNGGDTIAWRPDGPNDLHYAITVTTVGTSHLKATNIGDIEDSGDGKVVAFTEVKDLSGLPDALQGMAHNSGNTLSTRRHANFVLTNGAWSLQSIE
jgi:hypothetical protein